MGGRDFAALAKQFSEGPEASRGGLLGTFPRGAARASRSTGPSSSLAPGEVSEPVAGRARVPHPARRRVRAGGLPVVRRGAGARSARRSTDRRSRSGSRTGSRRTCASGTTSRCSTESRHLPRVRHPRHRRPRLRRRVRAPLGRAFGTLAAEQGASALAVGRDCRLTSDGYAAALRRGHPLERASTCSTSACARRRSSTSRIFHCDLDGGIQITGSHNPAEYNGFKICLGTRVAARRGDPGPAPPHRGADASGRAAGRCASQRRRAGRTRTTCVETVGPLARADRASSSTPATARAARSRRRSIARLGADVHVALLRDGRALPEPPPRSDGRGEPARQLIARGARDRGRARHRLRRRRRPHRRGRRGTATSSGATSCSCSSRATCCRATRARRSSAR